MADLQRHTRQDAARSTPVVVAVFVAAAAALMYGGTLLPGLDLGDTASFQTVVTLPLVVPRHAYPLYFALGKLFVAALGGSPAHAMNVMSAVFGALSAGAFAWLAWALTRSRTAALWGALMLAASYTFWSQAVIAEVYTLEALFIALTFIAALRWWRSPTAASLAWLYGIYALSFGNHLSMILFAPALALLLWHGRRRAAPNPFSIRGIALAALIASVGALQYAWNFHGLWAMTAPRASAWELVPTFWFDVTKTDWRGTLVGAAPMNQWGQRLDMYWWDLRQQFGLAGLAVAAAGVVALWRASRVWCAALLLAWSATFIFAFLYNVGDTHVFLLPSHQVAAMFAACGAAVLAGMAWRLRAGVRSIAIVLLLLVPLWRIVDTWPAVDRSGDRRAETFVDAALSGLDPQRSVYVADLNWQNQNAIGYELAIDRPELPRTLSAAVLWHFPEFVSRNHALGRDIVLTAPAAAKVRTVYGSHFAIEPDPRAPASTLASVPPPAAGTPYVLSLITPLTGFVFDRGRVDRVARALGADQLPRARYVVLAGVAGSPPLLRAAADRPFRVSARLPFGRLAVRIEAWVRFDTMRRAGFGHVVVNGRHALTLERGATLGIFDAGGGLASLAYEGGSFAVQPRYRIPVLR